MLPCSTKKAGKAQKLNGYTNIAEMTPMIN